MRDLARRGLGLLSLGGLLLLAFVIVSGAAYRPTRVVPGRSGGFPDWLRGPLGDFGWVLSLHDFGVYTAWMLGCFLVALVCATALRPAWVIGTVVALHLLFLLGPPLVSGDVFGYIDWARAGALHGLNPYATDSGTVVSDAVYPFVQWATNASPYGPLFTLGSYALVPLGVAGALWTLKIAIVGSSLGLCALIWAGARRRGLDPLPRVALYGLNPAVLVYALGGAHNDVLMMLPLLGGIYLVLGDRDRLGSVVASLAVAVKASAGLAMPFLILGARRRLDALLTGLLTGAVVVAVAFVAFGTHAADFVNVLGTQQSLDSATSVIAQLGGIFGWTGNPTGARTVASVVFGVALVGLVVRTWRRPEDWVECAGWATVALMVCTSWLLVWYIVWLAPLAALARARSLQVAAVGMTLFVLLTRLVPLIDL
ncbi:MAG: glycosyltransferase 87 family protein [Actinomycetota bacterium]|nr:glycosyltransferase 87 family protein [Actinomycetota bacterium]